MDQISFAEAEYSHKKKKTRREKFLEQMDKLIPWKRLENRIRRHYLNQGMAASPIRWTSCCASIACSYSTT